MFMKRIISFCLWNILVLLPLMPHTASAAPTGVAESRVVAASDTLIAVDENQLVAALITMVKQQQQMKEQRNRDTKDWLRTWLMVEAFGSPVNHEVTPSASVSALSARLAKLEQMVQQLLAQQHLVVQQRNTQQEISPALQQVLNEQAFILRQLQQQRPQKQRQISTFIPVPLPVNATRDDSLAHQLRLLEAQLKQLQSTDTSVVQINTPEMKRVTPTFSLESHNSLLPVNDSLIVQWVGDSPTLAIVPADFERSLFFSLSSAHLGADAKQKIAETLQFLTEFPQTRIVLRGYASPEGNRQYNIRLAQKRQQVVQRYLLQQGVDSRRIVLADCGVNHSAVGAQVARRVDISLEK